jgi:hypothetical protein
MGPDSDGPDFDGPDYDGSPPELLSYLEHTYIRGRRRPGRVER